MRRRTIGMLALGAVAVCGCNGTTKFANEATPPLPINMTVYINASRLSVSPDSTGAGPVTFTVTNQSKQAEAFQVMDLGGGQALADTAPINPGGTAQVTVDFNPGDYRLGTSSGTTDAALAAPSTVQPATIHISNPRPNTRNKLLRP